MAGLKRVGISVNTFDLDGSIILDLSETPDLAARTRRTSVVQTLDGGVVAQDGGYAHGDRQFAFILRATAEELRVLSHIFEVYGEVFVSVDEGCFLCSPRAITTVGGNEITLIFLVVSKLT